MDNLNSCLISGDLSLCRSQIGSLRTTSVSGDVTGTDNQIQKASLQSTSGDMELSGRYQEASVQVGSGDIALIQDGSSPSSLTCSSISGDTSLRVINGTGLNMKATSATGDVSVRFMGQNFRNSAPLKQTLTQKAGDGSTAVAVKSVSGDIRISEY